MRRSAGIWLTPCGLASSASIARSALLPGDLAHKGEVSPDLWNRAGQRTVADGVLIAVGRAALLRRGQRPRFRQSRNMLEESSLRLTSSRTIVSLPRRRWVSLPNWLASERRLRNHARGADRPFRRLQHGEGGFLDRQAGAVRRCHQIVSG